MVLNKRTDRLNGQRVRFRPLNWLEGLIIQSILTYKLDDRSQFMLLVSLSPILLHFKSVETKNGVD